MSFALPHPQAMSGPNPSASISSAEPGIQAWAQYWLGTSVGSIDLNASNDPIALTLRQHWAGQVQWLCAQHLVVDVGSGPAVLPAHLHRAAGVRMQNTHWICVEQAKLAEGQVNLPNVLLLDGVDFCSHRAPETLPGALVSNFGLEYTQRDLAASACKRWLRPGGRLHCVMHASGSPIDRASNWAASDIKQALSQSGLLANLHALILAAGSIPNDAAQRALHGRAQREAYNNVVADLKHRMQARGEVSPVWMDMFKLASALLPQALGGQTGAALQALEQHGQAYANEAQRANAMRASAMDEPQIEGFTAHLRASGFERVDTAALMSSLGSVAWVVQAVAGP